jgi:hypothetical protein
MEKWWELNECSSIFRKNIEQGIAQKLYREDINIESYVTFYFNLIFSIKESTSSEEESQKLEEILEYHTRAMATAAGIIELEKHLLNQTI